MMSVNLAKTL